MRWKTVALAVLVLGGAALAQDAMREAASGGIDPVSQDLLAPALATWIVESRDAAIVRGVAAIPAEIRESLEGFLPADVLEGVRWRIDGETGLVGRLLFHSGSVRAVTLDHVILFANAEEAANAKLWAHELYHVMQYRQWGIEGFAERFVVDHRAVEHAAREFRWSWMKATGRVPQV